MAHGLIHTGLLVIATIGALFARSRRLLLLVALIVLPLPAAMYNFYVEPASLVGVDLAALAAGSDKCRQQSRSDAAISPKGEQATEPGSECKEGPALARHPSLFVLLVINYMAVVVGVTAGLLARRPSRV